MRWFEAIRSLFETLRVPVGGPRRHIARYVEARLCAVRWMSGAFAPLAILSAYGMSFVDADTMQHVFHAPLPFAAWVPHLIIAVPALAFIFLVHRELTVEAACAYSGLIALCTIIGVGMLHGLSHMSMDLIGYGLAYFLIPAALPLRPLPTAGILLVGIVTSLVTAWMTGVGESDLVLIPAIVFAAVGLAAQSYGRISFMRYERAQLLLTRTTRRLRHQAAELQQRTDQLEREKRHSHQLLARTLTDPVARHLQHHRRFPPQVDEVVVIVCDIVGFSHICRELPAKQLVEALQQFFNQFDECCKRWCVEPVGSAGDSRIAIAGRWLSDRAAAVKPIERVPAVDALMAVREFQASRPQASRDDAPSLTHWSARLGVHVGPVMMGVMDGVRLSFDVWGETVNTAARLQQAAEPNTILASKRVLTCTRGLFKHSELRTVQVKQDRIDASVVHDLHADFRDAAGSPNQAFWQRYSDDDALLTDPAAPSPPGVPRLSH